VIREYIDGKWRWIKGQLLLPAAVLEGNGKWAKYSSTLSSPFSVNGKFPAVAVEIIGSTPEAIADEAQRLRDQAPDIEGGTVALRWASLYSTLDRDLVVGLIMILGPHDPEDVTYGPLPSVRHVVLSWIKRKLEWEQE
jgi:hypothetical protein